MTYYEVVINAETSPDSINYNAIGLPEIKRFTDYHDILPYLKKKYENWKYVDIKMLSDLEVMIDYTETQRQRGLKFRDYITINQIESKSVNIASLKKAILS